MFELERRIRVFEGTKLAQFSSVCVARRKSANAVIARFTDTGDKRMRAEDVHNVTQHGRNSRPPSLDTNLQHNMMNSVEVDSM